MRAPRDHVKGVKVFLMPMREMGKMWISLERKR